MLNRNISFRPQNPWYHTGPVSLYSWKVFFCIFYLIKRCFPDYEFSIESFLWTENEWHLSKPTYSIISISPLLTLGNAVCFRKHPEKMRHPGPWGNLALITYLSRISNTALFFVKVCWTNWSFFSLLFFPCRYFKNAKGWVQRFPIGIILQFIVYPSPVSKLHLEESKILANQNSSDHTGSFKFHACFILRKQISIVARCKKIQSRWNVISIHTFYRRMQK